METLMKKEFITIIFIIAVIFAAETSVQASSIWAKRNKNAKAAYTDDVARQIGDILTVTISENSTIDNKAKRDMQKETDRTSTFDGQLGNFADIGDLGMGASSSNSLSGKADYKDERKFEDSITVVVTDILPNGNLVITGQRKRDIAGDIQTIDISGIVRPSDIAFDNTVKSEQIAELKLLTKNSGISAGYTKPGWLGWILDIIWPF
jgi:flagellar L-ring protein FlgH